MQAGKFIRGIAGLFKSEGKWDISLLIAFILINSLVLLNVALHEPRRGYDGFAHMDYVNTLAKLRLPTPDESDEFFSPPLPYLFPSGLIAVTGMSLVHAAKAAQFLNALLSVGLIYYLIKICQLITPDRMVAFGALVFLGILPVYYRTFAFIRGEPYVAFFAVVGVFYFLKLFVEHEYTRRNTALAGLAIGFAVLSRQWGLLVIPGILLFGLIGWFREKQYRRSIINVLLVSIVIAFLLSGWFYFYLKKSYGSFTAFNRTPAASVSWSNQPQNFYFDVSPRLLFSKPVRPNFANELIPIFYSEIWGDYWGFFAVFGEDVTKPDELRMTGPWLSQFKVWEEVPSWMRTNYDSMGAYLGRVNLVSLFPSLLALVSIAAATGDVLRRKGVAETDDVVEKRKKCSCLLLLIIASTLVGYLWFLLRYPLLGKGDTIKATYLLHIFPVTAILVGVLLERIEQHSRLVSRFLIAALVLVALHNLPAMVTHYPIRPVFWAGNLKPESTGMKDRVAAVSWK